MPVTRSTSAEPVRTIWLGMRCAFTRAALAGAIEAGDAVVPVAVVLPRGPQPTSAGWPAPPFDRWLAERGIEIVEVNRLAGGDLDTIEGIIADRKIALGVGACLPWKVPARLRAALPLGVLNIHPSLLPALRGPEPVFHAFRQGLDVTGVTVHLMDDGWDSGPVLAQEAVPVPDGVGADAVEADLARRGGAMLVGLARDWRDGALAPRPQDHGRATWAPVPGPAERHLPETLTVAQAVRFLTACGPLTATDADSGATVAVDWLSAPGEQTVRVQVRDGELRLRRAGSGGVAPGAAPV